VNELTAAADVVAVGPGLGNRPDVADLVRSVLAERGAKPVVVDADGLNALSPLNEPMTGPAVFTPHPGEFARLTGKSTAEVQANRGPLAVEFAARFRLVLLLKGPHSVVTDGSRVYRNTTGNPGMATGGSGDVLAGVIAALIGQGLTAFDAAALGAWVHGRSGDLGAADLTQVCLTAADVLAYLPRAFREVVAG
jgi:NAD(P)H-hydrate epimerase